MTALLTIPLWFLETASAMAAEAGKASTQGLSAAPAPGGPSDANSGPPMTDIHDVKPILAMGADWPWLYWALAMVVLLILALLIWRWWKRRERPAASRPAAPVVAADEEAYGALDALAAENGMAPKQFYFRLSAILRRYVERRFDFPAAEMTTEELLPRMDQLPLDRALAGQFKSFCRSTDPVKFAGAAVRQDRLAHDLAFARDFVRQTTVVDTEQTDCSASETTNKHQKLCIYCQSRVGKTDDHVPPAMFFPEPRPSDLITVPACQICNAGFQKDEEYLRGLSRHLQKNPSEATIPLWTKIDRMLDRSPGLNKVIGDSIESSDLLAPNGSRVGKRLTVEENWNRVVVVMAKIVRGLYYFEFGEALPLSAHINCPDHHIADFNLSELYGKTKAGKRSWPRIFDYKFSRTEDEYEKSVWILRFYDSHHYIVFASINRKQGIEKMQNKQLEETASEMPPHK